MPKWIHERAEHILAKNPSMPKGEAFAIATQQSHAVGKSPKGYGTPEGRHTAKAKYDTPKDDKKTANPGSLDSPKMQKEALRHIDLLLAEALASGLIGGTAGGMKGHETGQTISGALRGGVGALGGSVLGEAGGLVGSAALRDVLRNHRVSLPSGNVQRKAILGTTMLGGALGGLGGYKALMHGLGEKPAEEAVPQKTAGMVISYDTDFKPAHATTHNEWLTSLFKRDGSFMVPSSLGYVEPMAKRAQWKGFVDEIQKIVK